MKKLFISLPWMAATTKKGYNLVAKVFGENLVVDISTTSPLFRIVCSKNGWENYFPEGWFRPSDPINKGVNTKNLLSILGYKLYNMDQEIKYGENTLETVSAFLDTKQKPLNAIYSFQRDILRIREDAAYKRRIKKIETLTKDIKEAPESFKTWCYKKLAKHYVLVKPFRGKKTTEGITSCCNKIITINKGEVLKKCPCCGTKVEMTRKKKIDLAQKDFILLQQKGEKLLQRHYGMWYQVIFTESEGIERWSVYEKGLKALDLATGDTKVLYRKYDPWSRKEFYDDKNLAGMNNIQFLDGPVKGLNVVTKIPTFRYSGIEYLDKADPIKYLGRYLKMPALEMLAKVGLKNLARNISESDMTKEYKKPWEMLRVNKVCFNRMREVNATVAQLKWYQFISESGAEIGDEDILWFTQNLVKPQNLDFVVSKMSYKQIRNYLEKQKGYWYYNIGIYSIINTWRDYFSMCDFFKKDLSLEMNYKPKNLRLAHDELANIKLAESREKEILEKFPTANEIIFTLKKYSYTDGTYSIVVPEGIKDIIKEGRILGHCLDRTDIYFDRICRHESYIFFLRKNEDIEAPFYSLEVEPDGTTRQKRTFGDRQDKDYQDCVSFIRKWQNHLKSVISDDDKAKASKSAELREANFKDLRERNEKVWHGLLAGQLLADVLEADLMLA